MTAPDVPDPEAMIEKARQAAADAERAVEEAMAGLTTEEEPGA